MKEYKNNSLTEKYESGESTLQEEQYLFTNAEKSESSTKTWYSFVNRNKRKVPENLNERLWTSLQTRIIRRRRLRIGIMSAAASILLLVSLIIGAPEQRKQSYDEKAALLNQALEMFDETGAESGNETILYEDEVLIIYSSLE